MCEREQIPAMLAAGAEPYWYRLDLYDLAPEWPEWFVQESLPEEEGLWH